MRHIDPELVKIVRENERMKMALRTIRSFANTAIFGLWRNRIVTLVDKALNDSK